MPLFGPPNIDKLKAKRDVKGLLKALGYEKASKVRAAAARALGEINASEASLPLVAALQDPAYDVHTAAAAALGKMRPPQAVEPLLAVLESGSEMMRIRAIEVLGQVADKRAVAPLMTTLGVSSEGIRQAAVKALGQIGDAGAIKPLLPFLEDANLQTRRTAAEALNALGWQPQKDRQGALYWIIRMDWEQCARVGAPAVEPLLAALEAEDSSKRFVAEALGKIGDHRAIEPLLAVAAVRDDWSGPAAIQALVRIGGPNLVEHLAALVRTNEGYVDKNVVNALEKTGDARAVDALLVCIGPGSYGDEGIFAAMRALGEIGDTRAVEPLVQALDTNERRKVDAVLDALSHFDAQVVEQSISNVLKRVSSEKSLVDLYVNHDRLVWNLFDFFKTRGWAYQDEIAASFAVVGGRSINRCADIGAPAVNPLIAALRYPEWRIAAAENLGKIEDMQAVSALIPLLSDTDFQMRRTAAAGLIRLYHAPGFGPENRDVIAKARQLIVERHVDVRFDMVCGSGHTDHGIGMDFPL